MSLNNFCHVAHIDRCEWANFNQAWDLQMFWPKLWAASSETVAGTRWNTSTEKSCLCLHLFMCLPYRFYRVRLHVFPLSALSYHFQMSSHSAPVILTADCYPPLSPNVISFKDSENWVSEVKLFNVLVILCVLHTITPLSCTALSSVCSITTADSVLCHFTSVAPFSENGFCGLIPSWWGWWTRGRAASS